MTFAHTNPCLKLKIIADNTTRDKSAISVPSCNTSRKLDNLKWPCHNMNICYILCKTPAFIFLKMCITKLLNLSDIALTIQDRRCCKKYNSGSFLALI